jgi:hypothetical protein
LGQVVERAEQKDGIDTCIGKGEVSRVAYVCARELRPWQPFGGVTRLLDVERNRVDQVDPIAQCRKP